jgi:hypothetical protein
MSNVPFSTYRLDSAAIDGGRLFKHPHGFRWRIASTRKKAYRKRLGELLEPHAAIRAAAPDSESARKVTEDAVLTAFAECIVTGWEGMFVSMDEPMPFSVEAVRAILADPDYSHVYDWVANCAAQDSAFNVIAESSDAKNSDAGSAGR